MFALAATAVLAVPQGPCGIVKSAQDQSMFGYTLSYLLSNSIILYEFILDSMLDFDCSD